MNIFLFNTYRIFIMLNWITSINTMQQHLDNDDYYKSVFFNLPKMLENTYAPITSQNILKCLITKRNILHIELDEEIKKIINKNMLKSDSWRTKIMSINSIQKKLIAVFHLIADTKKIPIEKYFFFKDDIEYFQITLVKKLSDFYRVYMKTSTHRIDPINFAQEFYYIIFELFKEYLNYVNMPFDIILKVDDKETYNSKIDKLIEHFTLLVSQTKNDNVYAIEKPESEFITRYKFENNLYSVIEIPLIRIFYDKCTVINNITELSLKYNIEDCFRESKNHLNKCTELEKNSDGKDYNNLTKETFYLFPSLRNFFKFYSYNKNQGDNIKALNDLFKKDCKSANVYLKMKSVMLKHPYMSLANLASMRDLDEFKVFQKQLEYYQIFAKFLLDGEADIGKLFEKLK